MADILPSIKTSPLKSHSGDGTKPDSPALSPTRDTVDGAKDGRPKTGGSEGGVSHDHPRHGGYHALPEMLIKAYSSVGNEWQELPKQAYSKPIKQPCRTNRA